MGKRKILKPQNKSAQPEKQQPNRIGKTVNKK
jgi:hypothetical protein